MPEPLTGGPPPLRHVEHVMGTVFSFAVADPPTPEIRRALGRAVARLHHVDRVFSTYRPDSAVSRLARGDPGGAADEPDVAEVLRLCDDAARVSGGWFSATPGGTLDPSGLVKGWAAEEASATLAAAGARNTLVNAGGDLRLRGGPAPGEPWRVGVSHPHHPGDLCTVVTGRDLAVATSGPSERGCHILDPHTGTAAATFSSITVVGPGLTLTDAYATAAYAMGDPAREWIEHLDGYEAFAVVDPHRAWWTSGFPGLGLFG